MNNPEDTTMAATGIKDPRINSPVYGQHAQLVTRWSDSQLGPIVDRLAPLLPANTTKKMKFAVAATALSICLEQIRTGGGVHYSRGKDRYRSAKRYRHADPYWSWYYVTKSIDMLEVAGLVRNFLGRWFPGNKGFQSVACATEKLSDLIGDLVRPSMVRGIKPNAETIVLRDRADKREIDYEETAETTVMRHEVDYINKSLSTLELWFRGERLWIPFGRRIFNGFFDRGGRVYFQGSSFQNMPAESRGDLRLLVEGDLHPVVELDFSAFHITMAYQEAGETLPLGDPYAIPGLARPVVKKAVNIMFNAASENEAILAITDNLRDDASLRAAAGFVSRDRRTLRPFVKTLVKAVEQKHYKIAGYFNSDCGARFMRRDSDMAMQIMMRVIAQTGRCPLPVHDSFLVADIDEQRLYRTMKEVAGECGLDIAIKKKDSQPTHFLQVSTPISTPIPHTPLTPPPSLHCPPHVVPAPSTTTHSFY